MKPRLPDDDIGQYLSTEVRLKRLEQAITPEPLRLVGAVGQPPFQSGWVNYDTARPAAFYRHQGRVYLSGAIKNGTVNLAAFTLPVGYLPLQGGASGVDAIFFSVMTNGSMGFLQVWANGLVVPAIGSNVYFNLEGINFRHA